MYAKDKGSKMTNKKTLIAENNFYLALIYSSNDDRIITIADKYYTASEIDRRGAMKRVFRK
jgi:hypothetical protein